MGHANLILIFYIACPICNKTTLKFLLCQSSSEEAAVDGISRIKKAALNALHVAASYGNTWLVKYLIEEIGVPV